MEKTRYSQENTAHRIDGYLFKRPQEMNNKPAFDRAKAELIKNLQNNIDEAKEMSYEEFNKVMKYSLSKKE